ncbi:hypothetical protein PALB_23140 [Pseudoalteromonas luteoviolacea B = ATCC 29581]|nr:hypothetical protein PALB_23140 [Pseudoalteromonas luteoviolacea B = ATCC 29581]
MQLSSTFKIEPTRHPGAATINCADNNAATRWINEEILAEQLGFPIERVLKLAKEGKIHGDYDKETEMWWFLPTEAQEYNSRKRAEFKNLYQVNLDTSKTSSLVNENVNHGTNTITPTSLNSQKYQDTSVGTAQTCFLIDKKEANVENTNFGFSKKTFKKYTLARSDMSSALSQTKIDEEKLKVRRDPYFSELSERIEEFSKLTKSDKVKKTDSLETRLKSYSDSGDMFDYVNILKLDIISRTDSNNLQLSFRSSSETDIKLRVILERKRGTLSLNTAEREKAIVTANQLIHKACLDKNITLVEHSGDLLSDVFHHMYINRCHSNNKTASESRRKLAVLSYLVGDIPLSQVDTRMINSTFALMFQNGWAHSTMNSYATELRKTLELAKDLSLIKEVPKVPSYKSNERNLIELPWEVWSQFIEHYSKNELEKRFLELLWHTGLRYTTLLLLEKNQILLKDKRIHLSASQNKAGKMMDVPLSEGAIECISKLFEYRAKHKIVDSRIFANTEGKLPNISPSRWSQAIKLCGLPEDFVRHHLRHYFATDLCRKGETLDTIARAGGWKSNESAKRYIHVTNLDAAIKAVNNRT